MWQRGNEALGEPEFANKGQRRRLVREQRIGPRIDDKTAHTIGPDDAAAYRRALEQAHLQPAPAKRSCGRQARNSATNHYNVEIVHSSPSKRAPSRISERNLVSPADCMTWNIPDTRRFRDPAVCAWVRTISHRRHSSSSGR